MESNAFDYIRQHEGHIDDCPDSELAQFSKADILEALCIYWDCLPLPTSVKDNENGEGE